MTTQLLLGAVALTAALLAAQPQEQGDDAPAPPRTPLERRVAAAVAYAKANNDLIRIPPERLTPDALTWGDLSLCAIVALVSGDQQAARLMHPQPGDPADHPTLVAVQLGVTAAVGAIMHQQAQVPVDQLVRAGVDSVKNLYEETAFAISVLKNLDKGGVAAVGARFSAMNFIQASQTFAAAVARGSDSDAVVAGVDVAAGAAAGIAYAAAGAAEGTALAAAGASAATVGAILAPVGAAFAVVSLGGMLADAFAKFCPCSHPRKEWHAGMPICYKGTCDREFGQGYVNQGDAACGLHCADTYGDCYYSTGVTCQRRVFGGCSGKQAFRDLKRRWRSTHPVVARLPSCDWNTHACLDAHVESCPALHATPIARAVDTWTSRGVV